MFTVNAINRLLPTVLLLAPLAAQACSFVPGYERFTPAPASFEPRREGERAAILPAPQAAVVRLQRAAGPSAGSCGDLGQLTLDLHWPRTSSYSLNEVGFYFRVIEGKLPDRIFPAVPISGKISGQRARFFFVWLDSDPSGRVPLDLELEVFAINKGLEIGPSTRVRISDAVRGR